MKDELKKDALTELVDEVSSQPDQPENNGTVSTPSGEMVELRYKWKKACDAINDFLKKLKQ